MLAIAGGLLLALGVLCGALLVAAALGLGQVQAGAMLWLLFPLFSVAGYALFVVGATPPTIRRLSGLLSGALMLLALAAAVALVLAAAAVLTPPEGTLSLWYVLAVAGVLGALGAATLRHDPAQG